MIFELTITNRMVAAGIDALCGFMGCERYQGDGRLIRTVPHPDDARRRVAKLTAEDLKDLGVTLVGHRRLLLDAIAALGA